MSVEAGPFELAGGELGVVCVHGFTGTPYEVRHLGERLHQRGMTVVAPRLPGHATDPAELDRTTWEDWFSEVDSTFARLRRSCARVCVAGQSLGGLLALELAMRRPAEVDAVAALAVPLWLTPLARCVVAAARRAPAFARWIPNLPKLGGHSDVRDRAAQRENPAYKVLPTRGVLELCAIMDRVRGRLAEVTTPLLVLHGERDHTAPAACAPFLADSVSSPQVRLRMLPRSYHLIALDVERDIVAAEVATFFQRASAKAS